MDFPEVRRVAEAFGGGQIREHGDRSVVEIATEAGFGASVLFAATIVRITEWLAAIAEAAYATIQVHSGSKLVVTEAPIASAALSSPVFVATAAR